ncbi:ATP-binding cassette domain-containing protein [Aquabacter cavernae]|uniref:ATP-binding cassette domain-containing protein n=1 Tax=Aquabacter cavernae TaxID=2496029 RepID=UPI000F8E4420|nr:ATP-binding cassette domain-containing protein [Aquabacter cavernae]
MNIALRDAQPAFSPQVRFEGAPFLAAPKVQAPAPDAGAAFAFQGVRKAFGPKAVLHGLDLTVPAGAFVAVIGKSGCGKSTLLRLLTGLDAPTSGAIAFEASGAKDPARLTRVMFQEPRLLPWARVVANVEVGLSHLRSKAERRRTALSLLADVGLADRADEWPSVLSGGQRQRVALARALASRPRILALDEPLGALDALTRIEMQQLLERIWLQQGFTAVLVTHDVAEAVALADRVVLVEEGRIALDLEIPLPRPRRRGSPELARLEGVILEKLLGSAA